MLRLTYPGLRLAEPDPQQHISSLLSSAERALGDLALVLGLFEKALAADHSLAKPERRLPFLYARLFVSSLNRVRLLLAALARLCPSTQTQADVFKQSFPNLAGVRDSSEHIDERLQGRAIKDRKPVALRGPVTMLENLHGRRFINTTPDEPQADVWISPVSVERAVACVQGAIDRLSWTGRPRVVELP